MVVHEALLLSSVQPGRDAKKGYESGYRAELMERNYRPQV